MKPMDATILEHISYWYHKFNQGTLFFHIILSIFSISPLLTLPNKYKNH